MRLGTNVFSRSARIALVYAIVAGAWIIFSDKFIEHAPPDVAGIPNQTVKGLLFVAVTAALLFALMARSLIVFRQRVIHMSTHDQLTALPTIEVLQDRVEQAIIHAKRAQAIVVILTLNIDRFQHVVNSYGFAAGDAILKGIATRLVEVTRPGDSVCRIGGDEFIVALFDVRERRDVDRLVSKLRNGLAEGLPYRGEVVRFSVSCGVAIYPEDGADGEALIAHSATALRRSKATDRGGVAFYTPALGEEARLWAQIEKALSDGIERNEFTLHYQPQIEARTSRCIGVEALLRWHSATLGSVPPGRFIPVAEASALIEIIGQWVIEQACAQAAKWREHDALVVSVNVSGRQLKDDGFVPKVERAVARAGIPAGRLELEITESMMMGDARSTLEKLGALKQFGVRIAIDDFGTGFSNLGQLRRFRADRLKIDQSFVRELADNPEASVLVSTIIAMGNNMGLSTIAEGVETREQATELKRLGCNEFQGYFFGRPMPIEQFEQAWAAGGGAWAVSAAVT